MGEILFVKALLAKQDEWHKTICRSQHKKDTDLSCSNLVGFFKINVFKGSIT